MVVELPDEVGLVGGAEKWLRKLPIGPAKRQIGEWVGDSLRLSRLKHLASIMEKMHRFAAKRGLTPEQAKALALHVGLPWIEKATLCEDESLQEKWAALLLSLVTEKHPEYSAGATYVRILGELDPWDCKVLDYMVREGGLSKSLFRQVSLWDELIEAVPDPEGHAGRTVLSIEKLVRVGCLAKSDTYVSRQDLGISLYGGIASYVSLTVTGLKFHIAVSGSRPGWLQKEDEFRQDMHPIEPLPSEEGKGTGSIEERERFLRLVEEFGSVHYRLLEGSKQDIRTVRDMIQGIDGKPSAAVKLEGRVAHPVKPGLKAWREIYDSGLVNISDPEIRMSEAAYRQSSLTPLGYRFLKFVEERKKAAEVAM